MDLNKCRTCFTDLDTNDFFLKLDAVHKNSKLTLAEKLKICVPEMDLKYSDKLQICMQCSMHLETAFTFRTTCLKTEDEFQKYLSQMLFNSKNSKRVREKHVEEEKKKENDHMFCHTCSINFSSKNIFDLHMRVMHSVKDNRSEKSCEERHIKKSPEIKNKELDGKNIEKTKLNNKDKSKNSRPLLQMVVLQTNIGSSLIEDSKKTCSNRKKRTKENLSKERLRKCREHVQKLKRDRKGRFLKIEPKVNQVTHKKVNIKPSMNAAKVNSKIISENKKINISLHKTNGCLYSCKFCPKQYSVQAALTRHLITIHQDKCDRCNVCGRYFTNSKMHRKKYGCKIKTTPLPNNLNSKKINYSFSKDMKFCYINSSDKHPICLICKKRCNSESDLKDHMLVNHKDSILCKKCHTSFSSFKYSVHLSVGCAERPCFNYTSDGECICPFCNKILASRAKLFGHFSHHSKEKLECKICHTIFDKLRSYGEHVVLGCENTKRRHEKDKTVYIKMDKESGSSLKLQKQLLVKDDSLAMVYNERETNTPSSSTYNQSDYVDTTTYDQSEYVDTSKMEVCNTIIDMGINKNIKVEPTELLDQNVFMMNENTCASPSIDRQFVNENSFMDAPELVYIL